MSHGEVLVMGGTSDARALCQQLDAAQVKYTLSVATPTGQQLAGDIRGQVRCGRLELEEMIAWLKANRTRWVIDASHPYAEAVSRNIVRACETAGVLLSRYQRPEQLSGLTHPLLYTVESIEQACEVARRFGQRVLLTTGSKDLARWRAGLGEKRCWPGCCRSPMSSPSAPDWGSALARSSPCAGRSAPSSTPLSTASAGPMW